MWAAGATASLVLPSGRTVKLAAFDMDGTLLNAQHTLSDASVRALRELSDAGIIVSLCTGLRRRRLRRTSSGSRCRSRCHASFTMARS